MKRRRKRIGTPTLRAMVAVKAGNVPSVDFHIGSTVTEERITVFLTADEFIRERFGSIFDYSITDLDLTEQFGVLAFEKGTPRFLRVDNGRETHQQCCCLVGGETKGVLMPPEQPRSNVFVESFTSEPRREFLGKDQGHLLNHAKTIIALWARRSTRIRQHLPFWPSTLIPYAEFKQLRINESSRMICTKNRGQIIMAPDETRKLSLS